MSYDLRRSHFSVILERQVLTGEVITEEGVVLEAVLDTDGQEKVKVHDGTGVVAGFAIRDNADNATTSEVETGTVPTAPAALTFQLRNNNLVAGTPGDGSTAQIRVVMGDGDVLTRVDGAPAAGQVQVEDVTGLLTFNSAEDSETFTVTYRYNLTVAESRLKFFQRNINNEAGTLFGQVGMGHGHGEIYTDQYDATVDWTTATTPTAIAGGLIGSGGAAMNARVISVPNVNNPLLGVAFNIGGDVT